MPGSRLPHLFALCLVAALIAGCGTTKKTTSTAGGPPLRGGGYYKDDGPGSNIPPGIEKIPDAVPRIEPHNAANFRPYSVLGQRFVPVSATTPLNQRGVASWYGRKFHGKKTANGETYDMYSMTAAHPTLPLPSYARVTHEQSGRSVIVRVNDRGPFLRGRVIDLSYAAAAKLGIIGQGSDVVRVEAITHADIRSGLNVASRSDSPPAAPVVQARPAARNTLAAAPSRPGPNTATSATSATLVASSAAGASVVAPVAAAPASAVGASIEATSATPDALAVLNEPGLGGGARAQGTTREAPAAPTPTVTEDTADGIYLQFGAFASYISADRLANRLNGEIAQVEVRDVHIDSRQDLHRVRIGPYPSRGAAVNAAVRIQEATGMRPALAAR